MAEQQPRPYAIGETNILVVGVEGVVEAITDETFTIAGHTLPRRLANGVRYLSMVWPEGPCEREHCDASCDPEPADSTDREDLEDLARLIRTEHETRHASEAMRFCNDPICREVYALGVQA
jgi:hypothetical protein